MFSYIHCLDLCLVLLSGGLHQKSYTALYSDSPNPIIGRRARRYSRTDPGTFFFLRAHTEGGGGCRLSFRESGLRLGAVSEALPSDERICPGSPSGGFFGERLS